MRWPNLASCRRLAALGSVALLTGFHLDLLLERLLDGTVLNPAVAGEWLLSLCILWLFWKFRRRGEPLLWSRKALALWFVVVLIHAVAVVPEADGGQRLALDRELLLGVPLGAALVALVASTVGPWAARRTRARALGRGRRLSWPSTLALRPAPVALAPAPRAPPLPLPQS